MSDTVLMDPQQLYELWERQTWGAHAIDLRRDRLDWQSLETDHREQLAWNLSSFFVGEERVTTQFSGLVRAYETQAEEAFLCTQQVDEARHAQFFARVWREVLDVDGSFEERMADARTRLNPAFAELFDERLVAAQDALLADPHDLEAKVDFVTTYHMVIEGTLALTGQFFVQDHLEKQGVLPGLLEGFGRIATDEHRHVAYGTWWLQGACEDAGLRRRAQARLEELVPLASMVLVPPGVEDPFDFELLGYRSEETHGFALTALRRRLGIIGIPLGGEAPAAA